MLEDKNKIENNKFEDSKENLEFSNSNDNKVNKKKEKGGTFNLYEKINLSEKGATVTVFVIAFIVLIILIVALVV